MAASGKTMQEVVKELGKSRQRVQQLISLLPADKRPLKTGKGYRFTAADIENLRAAMDTPQQSKAGASSSPSKQEDATQLLLDTLQQQLAEKDKQLAEKDRQLASASKALDQEQTLHLNAQHDLQQAKLELADAKKQLELVETTTPAENAAEGPVTPQNEASRGNEGNTVTNSDAINNTSDAEEHTWLWRFFH